MAINNSTEKILNTYPVSKGEFLEHITDASKHGGGSGGSANVFTYATEFKPTDVANDVTSDVSEFPHVISGLDSSASVDIEVLSSPENGSVPLDVAFPQKQSYYELGLNAASTLIPSRTGYTDIGSLRIIHGVTPNICESMNMSSGLVNVLIRIKLPVVPDNILSVTATSILSGCAIDGSELSTTDGAETKVHIIRIIDEYLYVLLDGGVAGIQQDVAISYNILTSNKVLDPGTGGAEEKVIDYTTITNKPKINNIELVGNKTAANLGLATANHAHTGYASTGHNHDTVYANISHTTDKNIHITAAERTAWNAAPKIWTKTITLSGNLNGQVLTVEHTLGVAPDMVFAYISDGGTTELNSGTASSPTTTFVFATIPLVSGKASASRIDLLIPDVDTSSSTKIFVSALYQG